MPSCNIGASSLWEGGGGGQWTRDSSHFMERPLHSALTLLLPLISLFNRKDFRKGGKKIFFGRARVKLPSIEAEFEVEGSGAERVEPLEAVEASVEALLLLLALRVHWVLAVVELGSHF